MRRLKSKVAAILGFSAPLFLYQNFTSIDEGVLTGDVHVVRVENFRMVGGKAVSDRQAVDAAVAEAIQRSASSKVRLAFEADRIYRLQRKLSDKTPDSIFPFIGLRDIAVNGNNALLLLERYDYVAEIRNSENIHFWNLRVDYAIPNHTQGRVVSVDTSSFLMDIDPGYAMPDKSENPQGWANSLSFDKEQRFLKDINIFIADVQNVNARRVRVIAESAYTSEIKKLKAGYKFAFRAFGEGGKTNFHIFQSRNVSFRNVDVYNTMKIAFTARYNEGSLLFDNVRVMRKPGSNRLIAGLSDGFHMKSNRAAITIRNSLIERTLDDGINLGSMAEVCHSHNAATLELELRDTGYIGKDVPNSAPLRVGDILYAFQFGENATKISLGSATITSVTPVNNKVRLVRLSKAIPGIVCLDPGTSIGVGGKFLQQWHATRFFSPEVSNPGFRILNNVIREKARNGILGKARGGQIRGNRFENMSGAGVDSTNNLMFNEGPVPLRMEISANTFKDILRDSIVFGISSYSSADLPTLNVNSSIVNNEFIGGRPMYLLNADQINVSGNLFTSTQINQPRTRNVTSLSANPATALFKLGSDFYFEGPGYICRYESSSLVANVWGDNFEAIAAVRTQFPPARHFLGACQNDEGISRLAGGTIVRKTRLAPEACNWGSVNRLHLGTGIINARQLGIVPVSYPLGGGICRY